MIHLSLPAALAALLAGLGVYGLLARRNAVLVLIGVELVLNAANLLLVTAGTRAAGAFAAGPVLTLFVITIAAAEITVALAIILVMFRRVGHIDLTAVPDLTTDAEDPDAPDELDVSMGGSARDTGPQPGSAQPEPARAGEGAP